MDKKFDVIFDNGGGTTLQVGKRYAHHYDNAKQAAEDVKFLLETNSVEGWDGHEPESRKIYNYEAERNGGYRWHDQDDVKRILKAGVLTYQENFGRNSQEFYETLGVTVED